MRVLSDVRRGRSEEHASLEVIAAATDSDQPRVVLARDFDERVPRSPVRAIVLTCNASAASATRSRAPASNALAFRGGFDERLG